jgi:hypothetical protein
MPISVEGGTLHRIHEIKLLVENCTARFRLALLGSLLLVNILLVELRFAVTMGVVLVEPTEYKVDIAFTVTQFFDDMARLSIDKGKREFLIRMALVHGNLSKPETWVSVCHFLCKHLMEFGLDTVAGVKEICPGEFCTLNHGIRIPGPTVYRQDRVFFSSYGTRMKSPT